MPTILDSWPNADNGWFGATLNGGANFAACCDVSTASWVGFNAVGNGFMIEGCPAYPALPAGAMIAGVSFYAKVDTMGAAQHAVITVRDGPGGADGGTVDTIANYTTYSNIQGPYAYDCPGTTTGWTKAQADGANITFSDRGDMNPSNRYRVYEFKKQMLYYTIPTISIVSPTGTITDGTPLVDWDFSGDGLNQTWLQLKMFTQAQYSAVGFDPETSTAAWDSGVISSSTTSRTCTQNLTDGVYRAYVKAAQSVAGRKHFSNWGFTQFTLNRQPNLPDLELPANGSHVDLAPGPVFTWDFNHDSPGIVQSAWAFRRKTTGAYSYWRASDSTWQASITFNPGAAESVDFPPGSWPVGPTNYFWSVNTQEADGDSSGFASDYLLVGNQPPTGTLVTPASSVTDTTKPQATWTYSDPESDPQEQFRLKLYVNSGTIDPDVTVPMWDSGVVASSLALATIDATLDNLGSYSLFLQVYSVGQWSAWNRKDFTINVTPPATPIMTVTLQTTNGRTKIDLEGHNNMLSLDTSEFETSVAGWEVDGNCTIARTTAQAANGLASMQLTRGAAAAPMSARMLTGFGLGLLPVIAGENYTAGAKFRASTAGKTVQTGIAWYNSSLAQISVAFQNGTDVTTAWSASLEYSAVAPAGAVFANVRVQVQSPGASEVHYVDEVFFMPGTAAQSAMNRGGWAGGFAYTVEYSDDGGTTWAPIRFGNAIKANNAQKLTVYDYEMLARKQRLYRAKTVGIL